jgi:hypothetical protein
MESWQDRVKDAVIETAAGDRFVFEFKDITSKRNEKVEIFEFANAQDYVQKKFAGSEVFDLALWFSGVECDKMADIFWLATRDNRPVRFTHPLIEKSFLMQITGLQRNDNLATSANEVAFNISMHETIDLENIVSPENVERYVNNQITKMNLYNSANFKNQIEIKEPSALAKIKAGMKKAIATVSNAAYAYEMTANVLAELQGIVLTAESLVETLETNAEAMAGVQQGLIQFAAKHLEFAEDRLDFYNKMLDWILDQINNPSNESDPLEVQLQAMGTISGLVLASILSDETTYITKTATFTQAEKIFNLADKMTAYAESAETDGLISNDIEQMEILNQIVRIAAGKLSEIAFRAKQERQVVLIAPTELYTFCYKFVGADNPDDLDNKVQSLIDINSIGGKELYELPIGKNVRFYL